MDLVPRSLVALSRERDRVRPMATTATVLATTEQATTANPTRTNTPYRWGGGYTTTIYYTDYAPAYRYRRVGRPAFAYYDGPVWRGARRRLAAGRLLLHGPPQRRT